ncbi:hypothetical protein P8452_42607 [Trifolium repens]|nr:hypothetical protein P8452_42607 [Trifolium repens]
MAVLGDNESIPMIQSLKKENISLLSESHYDIDNSRKYVRYSAEQIEALEKVYVECPKPSSMSRQQLIQENLVLSNIEPEQIKVKNGI